METSLSKSYPRWKSIFTKVYDLLQTTRTILLVYILFIQCIALKSIAQGGLYSISLNGENEYIDIGDEVINGCRSIELWFKLEKDIDKSIQSPITLLARDYNDGDATSTNEFALHFNPISWDTQDKAGKICFLRRVESDIYKIYSNSNYWPAGHWFHLAVTIEESEGMKMYLNGVLQEDTNPSNEPIGYRSGEATDIVAIGRWGYYDARYLEAELDEIRIWKSSLSELEIREKMCSRITAPDNRLQAYYSFDQHTDEFIFDISNNPYVGYLNNIDNSNFVLSGAPVGDLSKMEYQPSLINTNICLSSYNEGKFCVDNIESSSQGIHVYKVNGFPLSIINLNYPDPYNYFGVFLTSLEGSYSIKYQYDTELCSECDQLFSRNDNSSLVWENLDVNSSMCEFLINSESIIGYDYRAEYIVDYSIEEFDICLGKDTIICEGNELTIGVNDDYDEYIWNTGESTPNILVSEPGTYWLCASNPCFENCDSMQIETIDCICNLYFPNIFSPNSDGINDIFLPVTTCPITYFSINIYDRWGNLVYSGNDHLFGWDGRSKENDTVQGTYVYSVEYKTIFNDDLHFLSGDVVIIR